MSTRAEVVVNGRFLGATASGVQRVAKELLQALQRHMSDHPELGSRLSFNVWVPRTNQAAAATLGLPYTVVGPLAGVAWEQLTLPLKAGNRLVLSLCNVGPALTQQAVTMFHDAQIYESPNSYSTGFRWWYRIHQPLAGRRHARILTVSDYSRNQLSTYRVAKRENIAVVHNGVDHILRNPADETIVRRLGVHRHRYVVALAATQIHKNIGLLLQAFGSARLGSLQLVLFGSSQAQDFEALGLTVPSNVVFAGRISDGELRALYESALAMAFPSLTEGFGLPPLEAMTLGCPAIVAPCGALPEVCGSAALYADAYQPEAWVKTILELCNSPAAFRQRQLDSKAQAANFTWDAAAAKLIGEILALQPACKHAP